MNPLQTIPRGVRLGLRRATLRTRARASINAPIVAHAHVQSGQQIGSTVQKSSFSSSVFLFKGLQPDTSDPVPPNTDPTGPSPASLQPASLNENEYHEIADRYLDELTKAIEEKAEDLSAGIEMEYAQGVLNITTLQGTYVINKQPPNKQIWLSSPVSGPKRYDWVISGEGQNAKEGTETTLGDDGSVGGGRWLYLRDGSTLSDLLKDELKLVIGSKQDAVAEETDVSGATAP